MSVSNSTAVSSPASSAPINVAILAYPGLCLFEFASALEVFGQERPEYPKPHYRVEICVIESVNESDHLQVGLGDLALNTSGMSRSNALENADLIVIPGWRGLEHEPSAALVAELKLAYQRGATLATICSGVFLLAHAGLLDNKRATTHWRYMGQARRMFPSVVFDEAVLFVESDRIITSAGSAAGLDMCLHLVRQHYGQHIANAYARRLLIPPMREGGQAQFIQASQPVDVDRFSRLVALIEADLSQSYSVHKMAELVNLSERHFLRQFKATFADTPARWLTRLRLQRACDLLESTPWPIKKIAQQTGLGSEENMRHHFRKTLCTSPTDYRQTFGSVIN